MFSCLNVQNIIFHIFYIIVEPHFQGLFVPLRGAFPKSIVSQLWLQVLS